MIARSEKLRRGPPPGSRRPSASGRGVAGARSGLGYYLWLPCRRAAGAAGLRDHRCRPLRSPQRLSLSQEMANVGNTEGDVGGADRHAHLDGGEDLRPTARCQMGHWSENAPGSPPQRGWCEQPHLAELRAPSVSPMSWEISSLERGPQGFRPLPATQLSNVPTGELAWSPCSAATLGSSGGSTDRLAGRTEKSRIPFTASASANNLPPAT